MEQKNISLENEKTKSFKIRTIDWAPLSELQEKLTILWKWKQEIYEKNQKLHSLNSDLLGKLSRCEKEIQRKQEKISFIENENKRIHQIEAEVRERNNEIEKLNKTESLKEKQPGKTKDASLLSFKTTKIWRKEK